jgi:voltage-dependent anion channel protein 2
MSDKKPFVPPLWGKLGTNVKDLFTKKYTFKNQVITKHNAKNGVTLESGGVYTNELSGYVKATQKSKDLGTAEVNIETSGKADGKIKFDQFAKGLVVTISGNEKPSAKVNVDYSQEFFAGSASVDTVVKNFLTKLEGTAVVGFEGLSVGGQVKFDVSGTNELEDYNAAAEYSQDDFTATIQSADNTEKLTASYFQKVSPDLQVGASVDFGKGGRVLTLGDEFQLDADTTLKGKFNTKGVVAAVVEHRLPNPKLQFGVAASFNVFNNSPVVADQFGLTVTLGDY